MLLQAIEKISTSIKEKAYTDCSKSGHYCVVSSSTEPGKSYNVDVDINYNPVACQCRGNQFGHFCGHMIAVVKFYAPKLQYLTDEERNPVVNAIRCNKLIPVRWHQLTKSEKRAANAALFNL